MPMPASSIYPAPLTCRLDRVRPATLPRLWPQLTPGHRRQLALQLAELLRRVLAEPHAAAPGGEVRDEREH